MPTEQEEQEPQEGEGVVCVLHISSRGVRKALTESPVVSRGNELGFLMTISG